MVRAAFAAAWASRTGLASPKWRAPRCGCGLGVRPWWMGARVDPPRLRRHRRGHFPGHDCARPRTRTRRPVPLRLNDVRLSARVRCRHGLGRAFQLPSEADGRAAGFPARLSRAAARRSFLVRSAGAAAPEASIRAVAFDGQPPPARVANSGRPAAPASDPPDCRVRANWIAGASDARGPPSAHLQGERTRRVAAEMRIPRPRSARPATPALAEARRGPRAQAMTLRQPPARNRHMLRVAAFSVRESLRRRLFSGKALSGAGRGLSADRG